MIMNATRTLILAGIAAALLPGGSLAQDSDNQGYLVDSYGNNIVTSGTGLCWRTSDWTPARSVEPCDPVARKVEAPAPRVAAALPRDPAPAPALTPAPAPAPALTPAPVVLQNIHFSADALFAFDRSVLRPAGKNALDDFVGKLDGVQYETILVTGHTDRFGSLEYNKKLSERRAHAVKAYLMSRDVPGHRIVADGKGETVPVTRAGDCQGAKSVRVIECLQPDRRVHVEVVGTR
jgi:OmpA-OmpF porin, OOP family